jgi:hypothetical protein
MVEEKIGLYASHRQFYVQDSEPVEPLAIEAASAKLAHRDRPYLTTEQFIERQDKGILG